jgi:hypothetical protein
MCTVETHCHRSLRPRAKSWDVGACAPRRASARRDLSRRGYSNAALALLPDASVDIFYINAGDGYAAVAEGLSVIKYKIVPSGWIVLSNYTLGNVASEPRYGLIHAAHEFILAEGWEMWSQSDGRHLGSSRGTGRSVDPSGLVHMILTSRWRTAISIMMAS